MELVKSISSGSCENVGDIIIYEYSITNTGNVPITGQPFIIDDKIGNIVCPPLPLGGLLSGQAISTTAQTVVTQDILNDGELCNTARASGSTVLGDLVSNATTLCIDCGSGVSITSPTCPHPNGLLVDCSQIPLSISGFTNATNIAFSTSTHTFSPILNNTAVEISGQGINEVVTITATNGSTGESCSFDVTINGCTSTESGVAQFTNISAFADTNNFIDPNSIIYFGLECGQTPTGTPINYGTCPNNPIICEGIWFTRFMSDAVSGNETLYIGLSAAPTAPVTLTFPSGGVVTIPAGFSGSASGTNGGFPISASISGDIISATNSGVLDLSWVC